MQKLNLNLACQSLKAELLTPCDSTSNTETGTEPTPDKWERLLLPLMGEFIFDTSLDLILGQPLLETGKRRDKVTEVPGSPYGHSAHTVTEAGRDAGPG
jgi:hypothetical protein